jgi:hypothetical protein
MVIHTSMIYEEIYKGMALLLQQLFQAATIIETQLE